ncbi:DUF1304 domain-containing protein [Amnibacterium flavum]|uniref:DUF1304 domain-containing protein n=1 Tax=Amnibacterium flavum TaxID=2173173 RepID=A0A2V1HNV8_9MICO|nr:DUF1304 domain-containing protein [Amnibacterium flavum]PVZ94286.1 DUF1304 domain-containing protein [Amnibacterium flavum]
MPLAVLASVFVLLAGVLHGYIFLMESVWWTRPTIWRRFGVGSQADAEVLRPMAYNQGFYNLFLGVGAVLGTVLFWSGAPEVGRGIAMFATGSMVLASLVLLSTGARNLRPALIQGVLPLIGFVFFLFVWR